MYFFEFRIARHIGFLTHMNRKRQIIECLSVITEYRSAASSANDKAAFRAFLFFQTQMRFSRNCIARKPCPVFRLFIPYLRSAIFTVCHRFHSLTYFCSDGNGSIGGISIVIFMIRFTFEPLNLYNVGCMSSARSNILLLSFRVSLYVSAIMFCT